MNTNLISFDSGKKVMNASGNKKRQLSLQIDLDGAQANDNLHNPRKHMMFAAKSDEVFESNRKNCSTLLFTESESIDGEMNNERKQGTIDIDYKKGMSPISGT